jgi:hypothetical protein
MKRGLLLLAVLVLAVLLYGCSKSPNTFCSEPSGISFDSSMEINSILETEGGFVVTLDNKITLIVGEDDANLDVGKVLENSNITFDESDGVYSYAVDKLVEGNSSLHALTREKNGFMISLYYPLESGDDSLSILTHVENTLARGCTP